MKNELINTFPVESDFGTKFFSLFFGDVLEERCDALLLSTHANPSLPLTGQVLEGIKRKHSLTFSPVERLMAPERYVKVDRLKESLKATPYQDIFLIRIPQGSFCDSSKERYNKAIWAMFSSLSAMELRGKKYRSIAFPLLGGTRDYSIEEQMKILLTESVRWLQFSRATEQISFFIFEKEHLEQWDNAMNSCLNRFSSFHHQDSLALKKEVLSAMKGLSSHQIASCHFFSSIHRILTQQGKFPIQQLAAICRVFLEYVVFFFLQRFNIRPESNLSKNINKLQQEQAIAPWIISHFHLLRTLGNESVHYSHTPSYLPSSIGEEDYVSLLSSFLRILKLLDSGGREKSEQKNAEDIG